MKWWVLRRKLCKCIGVNPLKARLAYRQLHDVLHGSFCQLRGVNDWGLAISKLSQAIEENSSTELEIMDVCTLSVSVCNLLAVIYLISKSQKSSRGRRQAWTSPPIPAITALSNQSIPIETYFFQYHTVDDLLKLLADDSGVFASGWSLRGVNLQDVLKRVGMENMDDFCLTSPLALHTSSGIPAQAVTLLYIGAEKLIRLVHQQRSGEIREIQDMRDEYARMREFESMKLRLEDMGSDRSQN